MTAWAVKIDGKVYKQYRVTRKGDFPIHMGFPFTSQTPAEYCKEHGWNPDNYSLEQLPLSLWKVENHEIVATEPDEEYKPSYMGGKK